MINNEYEQKVCEEAYRQKSSYCGGGVVGGDAIGSMSNQKESHVFTEMNILKKEISVLKQEASELISGLLPVLVDEKTELTTDAKEPAEDYLVPLANDIRSLRRQIAGVSFALGSAVRRLEL